MKKKSLGEKLEYLKKKIQTLNISNVVEAKLINNHLYLVHKKTKESKKVTNAYYSQFMNKKTSNLHKVFVKTRKEELVAQFSKMGKDSDHPYECLDYKNQKALIKCLKTNKKKWVDYQRIISGYHPFNRDVRAGTSTGELSTISFLNKLFKVKFKKVKPSWLINPKTGFRLELDGYCENKKLAIEYGSHVATRNGFYFRDQKYTKFKDNLKQKICKDQGVTLINIPDLNGLSPKTAKTLLKKILEKNKVKYNLNRFNKIQFIYINIPGAYTKDQVWSVVKKCENRSDLEYNHKGVWRAAERLGIINEVVDYFKQKRQNLGFNRWNKEKLFTSVRKLVKEKKNYSDFCKNFPGAYKFAQQNGFLSEVKRMFPEKQKSWGFWLNIKNAENALKKCENKKELQQNYSGLYRSINHHPHHYSSLYSKYPWIKVIYKKTMTDLEIKSNLKGINSLKDLYRLQKPTWTYLKRNNLMEKYTSHMLRKKDIASKNKEKNFQIKTKEASKFKNIYELKKNNYCLYKYIQRNNLKDRVKFFAKG